MRPLPTYRFLSLHPKFSSKSGRAPPCFDIPTEFYRTNNALSRWFSQNLYWILDRHAFCSLLWSRPRHLHRFCIAICAIRKRKFSFSTFHQMNAFQLQFQVSNAISLLHLIVCSFQWISSQFRGSDKTMRTNIWRDILLITLYASCVTYNLIQSESQTRYEY